MKILGSAINSDSEIELFVLAFPKTANLSVLEIETSLNKSFKPSWFLQMTVAWYALFFAKASSPWKFFKSFNFWTNESSLKDSVRDSYAVAALYVYSEELKLIKM